MQAQKGRRLARYRRENGKLVVDLQVTDLRQLFDLRDPTPFRDRDLDEKAVEYILGAMDEIGHREPFKIVIYYSEEIEGIATDAVASAFHGHFSYGADVLRKKVIQSFRQGRIFFLIGVLFLSALLSLAELVSNSDLLFKNLLREGLTITAWVAMWKPLDTFLYGWWPLKQREKSYEKLSTVEVELVKTGRIEN